jgi:hypothetical protein
MSCGRFWRASESAVRRFCLGPYRGNISCASAARATAHRIETAAFGGDGVHLAAILATLATLDLAAPAIGRTATWIIQPILLIAGGPITASQVFTVRFVEAAFRKSQDRAARAVDVRRLMDAASAALPAWLRPMVVTRFVLVTLGSALVLLLLAVG